jgi:hypothetical protein
MDITFSLREVDVYDGVMPLCPEEVIPDRELERLNQEILDLADASAFDPANEILEP